MDLPQGDLRGDPCMILEDLLHDRDCCLFMLLHHDDSIMDGEGYDTFRPEGFLDFHKNDGLFAERVMPESL